MDFKEHLRYNYFKEGHPLYLASLKKIYQYYEGQIPEEDIVDVISSHDPYSIHKEYKKGQRNVSYSNFKRYQFQCDLIDVRHLAEYNDNVNYIFTCIDTFTRFPFVRLLESKHGYCAVKAFQSILEEAETPPLTLVMDRGSEFYNDEFQSFCESMGIKYFPPDSSSHGAYIERFNRTLQGIIYKHMTLHETYRYITLEDKGNVYNMMPYFLATYYNSYHRMIGTTPAIAEEDESTHLEIRKRMSEYRNKVKKKKIKFQVGDKVRIKKLSGKFSRGYEEQSNEEIFRIHKIKTNMPIPMYVLSDYDGTEVIRGSFYSNELVKMNEKEDFKIERVLRRRKRNGVNELFVKWKGWPDKYNQWISEDDVTQRY